MAIINAQCRMSAPTYHAPFNEREIFIVGMFRGSSFVQCCTFDNYEDAVNRYLDNQLRNPDEQYCVVRQRVQLILENYNV